MNAHPGGDAPVVLLLVASWTLALVLLVVVARGPENHHRLVVRHVRPDAVEPTPRGFTLLFWRNLLLLVLVAWFAAARTVDALGPTQDDLVASTELVTDLVPADELDGDRLEAELRLLHGDEVVVDDASEAIPEPEDDELSGETVLASAFEVRRLGLGERLTGDADDEGGTEPASCVVVERTSYSGLGQPTGVAPDDSVSVAVSTGRCGEED